MTSLNEAQSYPKSKLKFTSPGLFGRDQEAATLQTCFMRMMDKERASFEFNSKFSHTFTNSTVPKEFIFIKGQSGVGKSTLAASLEKDVSAVEHGLFVKGKFDLMASTEPFSGIAKALGKICKKLRSSPEEWAGAVCKMISCDFREEMQALLPLIPDLKEIVNSHASQIRAPMKIHKVIRPVQNGTEQLKHAFRLLVRALNAAFTPIVLVLDDLQWADLSSLHVIDYLVSDKQNANRLMIIGCYRSEEVLGKSNLSSLITTLEEKKNNYGFNVTEIALNSCQVDHVNKMIMSIMAIEDEKETEELAETCYRRTLGNPFFVMQFMAMLENEGLVSYDESKWVWNVDEIERRTKNTKDVSALLQARMRKLPEDAQLLLQYAACLDTTFSLSTIDIIWREHGPVGIVSNLEKLLILLEGAGFLESDGDNAFKWVHDKVQEAAMTLTNVVNASFKFKIGKTLVTALDEEQLEDELFDVVDLINRGDVATRPELAALNLRAAKKARDLSAYQSSAQYVEFGAAFLPRSHWTSHRALTLELYAVGAEMELALGNTRQAASYCDAVFNREDCTLMEGLPLRMAVIAKLSGGDSALKRKALDMCLELLRLLGYDFLWPNLFLPVQTAVALIQTGKQMKRRLRQKGVSESMGDMTDPKHLAIMELLVRVGYLSYTLEEILLIALSRCHMVKMTLKHGKCNLSGKCFSDIGIVSWIVLNEKFSTVLAYVQHGLALQEVLDPQYEGNTIWSAHTFCLCWSTPLQKCVQSYQQAYKSSMKVGNVEFGMWSMAVLHAWIPYVQGSPISKILKNTPHVVSHMEELRQMEQALMVRMYWQLFLNLQSDSENGSKLTGMVFDNKRNPLTTGPTRGAFHFLEGELIFMYDLETAADRAVQYGEKYLKLCPAAFPGMVEMFHRGVALYATARLRCKRKYRTRAMKIRKTIKQWIRDGNPNVEHYDLFLDAEHASLTPKGQAEADGLYQKAIKSATQAGHIQHKALFNERYADFLLQVRGDEVRASYRLSEAIGGYQQWGALRKADQIRHHLRELKPYMSRRSFGLRQGPV